MAKENYDELIDQKLTELYDVLTALNSLKEKTAAVQQVVESLSKAGEGRVAEIETAIGRLGGGINKSVDIIRNTFSTSTADAKTSLEKSVKDAKASISEAVTAVTTAIAEAGKDRVDGMQTTADTFSAALEKLVQSSNEGTAKMSKFVAELKGMPLVEELREFKQDNAKQTEELKAVIAEVGATATKAVNEIVDLISKLNAVKESIAEAKASFVDGQKNMANEIGKGFKKCNDASEDLKRLTGEESAKVCAGFEKLASLASDKAEGIVLSVSALNKSITKLADDFDAAVKELKSEVSKSARSVVKSLEDESCTVRKQCDDAFVEQEKVIRKIGKDSAEAQAKTQKQIKVIGGIIIALVVLVGIELAPLAIRAWKAFLQ